jgi:hypothetical protein
VRQAGWEWRRQRMKLLMLGNLRSCVGDNPLPNWMLKKLAFK